MYFSFFNAVLNLSSFTPYDPWFAGGYINYYYYGFVLAAMPVKLLGIVPTMAYNFILPTWFAMIAIGAFAIGFSVVEKPESDVDEDGHPPVDLRLVAGLAAAVLTMLIGNLGTVQLIFNAAQRIVAPDGAVPVVPTFVQHW